MLAHRHRRCTKIKPALPQCRVFIAKLDLALHHVSAWNANHSRIVRSSHHHKWLNMLKCLKYFLGVELF